MIIKKIVLCVCLMACLVGQAQNDTVLFSAQGGFYEDVFQLELYNYYPQNHIRYTTDGNRPTAQSPLYEEALVMDEHLFSNHRHQLSHTGLLSPRLGGPLHRDSCRCF